MLTQSLITLATVAVVSAQGTYNAQNQTQVDCYAKYNSCRTTPVNGLSANQAGCAADFAACLGFSPFGPDGTNTVTPSYSLPAASSTQVTASPSAIGCVDAFNKCRQPAADGTPANQAVCAAENAQCKDKCQAAYNTCRTTQVNGLSANQAACAADFAACNGETPATSTSTTATATPSAASCADSFDKCRQPAADGTSANQAACAAENAQCKSKCQDAFDTCRTTRVNGLSANQAACAADFAACTGSDGTSSDAYTTKVVTAYTTVCPSPTVFTHEQSVYTVSSSTTITLQCPGGCTITSPVAVPPTTLARPSNSAAATTSATRAVYTGGAVKMGSSGAFLAGALGLLVL